MILTVSINYKLIQTVSFMINTEFNVLDRKRFREELTDFNTPITKFLPSS